MAKKCEKIILQFVNLNNANPHLLFHVGYQVFKAAIKTLGTLRSTTRQARRRGVNIFEQGKLFGI